MVFGDHLVLAHHFTKLLRFIRIVQQHTLLQKTACFLQFWLIHSETKPLQKGQKI